MLKVQMPANDWEWHCLTQVQERCSTLSHPLTGSGLDWTGGFMAAPRCYTYRDGSVLVTQYQVIQLLWAGRSLLNVQKPSPIKILKLELHRTAPQRMGTLLDLVNLTKNADKAITEPLALHLTAELLGLIEILHSCRIVHADIKPDNFLVRHTPATR